jgi:glycosyltransferase involved in cell wall biosynthesis
MPTATIGIPVFNEEAFLAATVESALRQSLVDIEILIADNCSSDRSATIAEHYARNDSRVSVLCHRENRGAPANFECLVSAARSDYFVWLGAHDIFGPQYLERTVGVLNGDPSVAMVYPRAIMIDGQGRETGIEANDVDTTCLPLGRRLEKIVTNLGMCSAIHGVFRTHVLRQLVPFQRVVGADRLLLFKLGFLGHIRQLETFDISRREFRNETSDQTHARRQQAGIYGPVGPRSPYALLAWKHVESVFASQELSLADKLRLLRAIRRKILHTRTGWYHLINEAVFQLSTRRVH